MKTAIVIDSLALGYSAMYSFGHLSYAGTETGVIYGFLSRLKKFGEQFKTNDITLCWDSSIKKLHRYKDYKGYKQPRQDQRNKMTDEEHAIRMSFLSQVDKLRDDVIPGMGFGNNFHYDGYEADDLIAIWVQRLYHLGYKVIMITSDQDMYQVLDWCDMLSLVRIKRDTLFTKEDLKKWYNIEPCNWAYAKAIGGCNGDGVKGIYGVSDPKKPTSKALRYINGDLTKGVIYERITSKRGRRIIKKNLPIVTTPYKPELLPRMIRRRNTFTIKKFISTFDRFGFRSFIEKEQMFKWKKVFLE